jgi:hypothetical protein
MHMVAEMKFNSEMHLETVIELVWRFIWRPKSRNSEICSEAIIERVLGCIWRLRSSN